MMRLFEILLARRPRTADVAKERLQLVLAHERAGRERSDFLPALQRELIAIVQKYVAARDEAIEVRMGQHGGAAVLEINIELPPKGKTPAAR
jgi:cell division topological specificity factor